MRFYFNRTEFVNALVNGTEYDGEVYEPTIDILNDDNYAVVIDETNGNRDFNSADDAKWVNATNFIRSMTCRSLVDCTSTEKHFSVEKKDAEMTINNKTVKEVSDTVSRFREMEKRFSTRYGDSHGTFDVGRIANPIDFVEVKGVTGIRMERGIMFSLDNVDYVCGNMIFDDGYEIPYYISYNHVTRSYHYQDLEKFDDCDTTYVPSGSSYEEMMEFIVNNNYGLYWNGQYVEYVIVDKESGEILHASNGSADYTNALFKTVLENGKCYDTLLDLYDDIEFFVHDNGKFVCIPDNKTLTKKVNENMRKG